METEANRPSCRNTSCQVSATGACIEGHTPLLSCPHFGGPDVDHSLNDASAHVDEALSSTGDSYVKIDSGDSLILDDVRALLRWRPAIQVAVLGEQSSGKTTLVCALHDRFLRGPYAGLSFVASRSLIAVERRSHYSRIDSGTSKPDTPRTSFKDGLRYLHFAVAPTGSPDQRADLLISDRAGETYRRAKDDISGVADLTEVFDAHRVVLLLDGGRVANVETRASAMQGVRQLLRALLDGGALGPDANVQIVTTKMDLVELAPDKEAVLMALNAFSRRLSDAFSSRLGMLTYWSIASRPEGDKLEPAFGLDRLLKDWLTPPKSPTRLHLYSLRLITEFDRLLSRTNLG